ncbi:hypothetical protein DdX_18500 [Ditylenchus destructor]|uniref:Uncharacterized protein n=1 Tax=Ditylenchus destructor TaxID=166010 RepID=A0AAD4MPF0_9BILA|nr:hypothetical protein DdX_18500 [Ditylenchus destructor]
MKDPKILLLKNEITERMINICHNRWNTHVKTKFVCDNDNVDKLSNMDTNIVVTNIDKAGNNFAFICKTLYITNICNELGIVINNHGQLDIKGNNTYSPVCNGDNVIFQKLTSFYKSTSEFTPLRGEIHLEAGVCTASYWVLHRFAHRHQRSDWVVPKHDLPTYCWWDPYE